MKQCLGYVLLIAMAGIPMEAQQTATTQPVTPPATTIQNAHQSAVELVEAIGMRELMLAQLDKIMQAGKDEMVKNDPNVNPAFV